MLFLYQIVWEQTNIGPNGYAFGQEIAINFPTWVKKIKII